MNSSKKKPPDKYRCLKLPLHHILKKDTNNQTFLGILQDTINATNDITAKTYLVLRRWILDKYMTNSIPEITKDTIHMCMRAVKLPAGGGQPTKLNKILFDEFEQLVQSLQITRVDGYHLSAILDYYTKTMLPSIDNNIKLHFFDYVNRFLNSYFKNLYDYEHMNKDQRNQLFKELKQVKSDIINRNEPKTSDPKYHQWLDNNIDNIVPPEFNHNYHYDIKESPSKYLKHMIFMCLELEKIGAKSFQFFPLQSNCIPKHIQLDTKALVELFIDPIEHTKLLSKCFMDNKTKTKSNLFSYISDNKELIWDELFNMNDNFEMNHYVFDYAINTDGYSVSIRFIHDDFVDTQNLIKDKQRKGRQSTVKIPKDEPVSKKSKIKTKPIYQEKNLYDEFPYIDDVPKDDLQGKHIFIDPGKRCLFSMMDDNGQYVMYNNRKHLKGTKRLKYQRLLHNYKNKLEISPLEAQLSGFNSKSCDRIEFTEYLHKKLETSNKTVSLYWDKKFRQYKWYAYINNMRTTDNMINEIKSTFSKDHIIIIGDWGIGKQMRNFISTPNLTLKRKLSNHFKIYNIDEFRTSCVSYKTGERCENLHLKFKNDKYDKLRKLHSVLTFKMENNRLGCINRDKNGCKNIQKIFDYYMGTGQRPELYSRSHKLPNKKQNNLELSTSNVLSACKGTISNNYFI